MKKIFIFDAYPSTRELLSEDLAAEGNTVVATGKPAIVSNVVEMLNPDLVILDLYVRGKMRWDLLVDLKAFHPQIPVLIFTEGRFPKDSRVRLADAWVRKSLFFDEVKGKLLPLLEGSKKSGASGRARFRLFGEQMAS